MRGLLFLVFGSRLTPLKLSKAPASRTDQETGKEEGQGERGGGSRAVLLMRAAGHVLS